MLFYTSFDFFGRGDACDFAYLNGYGGFHGSWKGYLSIEVRLFEVHMKLGI